jgi:hypothetical protein
MLQSGKARLSDHNIDSVSTIPDHGCPSRLILILQTPLARNLRGAASSAVSVAAQEAFQPGDSSLRTSVTACLRDAAAAQYRVVLPLVAVTIWTLLTKVSICLDLTTFSRPVGAVGAVRIRSSEQRNRGHEQPDKDRQHDRRDEPFS